MRGEPPHVTVVLGQICHGSAYKESGYDQPLSAMLDAAVLLRQPPCLAPTHQHTRYGTEQLPLLLVFLHRITAGLFHAFAERLRGKQFHLARVRHNP